MEQLRKSPNMSFSGAVKIADLSDFIAPAQSCVVSLSGSRLKTDDLDEVIIAPRVSACCARRAVEAIHPRLILSKANVGV